MCSKSVDFDPDRDIPDLTGQVIIVTGGNSGLGFETIRQLSKHAPAHVYLAARSKEKAETAIQKIRDSVTNAAPLSFLPLDLSSFDSIKSAAHEFQRLESRLDILVNNAGIMFTPEGLTKDGYEIQFGTNHMGHALFIELLLPILQSTAKINPETRVVNLASASESLAPNDIYNFDELKTIASHRSTQNRYTISKMANIHYNYYLAQKHSSSGVKFICVHPGMVATNLHTNATGFFLKAFIYTAGVFATPVEKGARNQLWASVSSDAKNGEYYAPVGVAPAGSKQTKNRDLQTQLGEWTQKELSAHV
ncbi:hypothetical protein AARAC_003030 [Aspergillus arachidicola]|uniref:Short-chain dehydrogenase n=1 Tax=Aspergillus arachidicola TaxID=656916 RepID=A0A2G7G0K7_9EURO|nr:hypothetical protein AARAC_003030 [Aspergillus arachidicola]